MSSRFSWRFWTVFAALLAACAGAAACGGSTDRSGGGAASGAGGSGGAQGGAQAGVGGQKGGRGGAGGIGGASGSVGANGGGFGGTRGFGGAQGAGAFGGSGGSFGFGGMTGSGGSGGGVCASVSVAAEPVPLAIYMLLGTSASTLAANKWDMVRNGLGAFAMSAGSGNLSIGVGYFPIRDAAQSDSCTVSDYTRPAVQFGALPGNVAAISSSISAQMPAGGSPALPALEGAITHAAGWAVTHAGQRVIVVLVMDGTPSGCGSTVVNVAQAALVGSYGSPPISTFVIGVGGALAALDPIAQSGGTERALTASTTQEFIDALNRIRGRSQGCAFQVPIPSPNQTLDFNRVNVQLTDASGRQVIIPRVNGFADCDPIVGGWFYDAPNAPTTITLCPNSCDLVLSNGGGRVAILLGCDTITK